MLRAGINSGEGAGSPVFLIHSLTPAYGKCDRGERGEDEYVLWLPDAVSTELGILLSSFLTNER